ncbi:hypothetical protein SEA_BARKLEY26_47 [Mycobacterium phage Barkley26]|nr:hypothetical protein SEA_BARKLEY26_47 [Mycobacterium phage Barkley26]
MSVEAGDRLAPAPVAFELSTGTAAEVQAETMAWIRANLAACHGCGVSLGAEDPEHRPDCTVQPAPLLCHDCDAIRLPSERSPVWRFNATTRTYHCPNHPTHQKGTK